MIVPRGSTVGMYMPGRRRGRGMGWRPAWPHEAGLGRWRGLSGPATGYADFNSYNTAVCLPLSGASVCPPPFDPACIGPAQQAVSACQAAWVSDPTSCHNVVCDSSGQPAVSVQPYTTPQGTAAIGTGYNTVAGFVPTVPAPAPAPAPAASAPKPSIGSPVFHPGKTLKPIGPLRPRPVPIQSASAAAAPGGILAPAAAPTPVQTQTPPGNAAPPDWWTSFIQSLRQTPSGNTTYPGPPTVSYTSCDPVNAPWSSCPGGAVIGPDGSPGVCGPCGGPIGPVGGPVSFLSSIPWWGWGVAAVGVIFLTRSGGGKR